MTAICGQGQNGKDMTNNPYFGAEAEYILWGNDSVTKNLQSTPCHDLGIRFGSERRGTPSQYQHRYHRAGSRLAPQPSG